MIDDKPWLTFMTQRMGTPTVTGALPTQMIEEAFERHTTYGKLHGTTPSSCAAVLCMALETNGYLSPHSAAAVDFARVGLGCTLKPGAIGVFKWKNGEHHVSVCRKVLSDNEAVFIGANQHHEIDDAVYQRKYLVAVRWPVPLPVKGVA